MGCGASGGRAVSPLPRCLNMPMGLASSSYLIRNWCSLSYMACHPASFRFSSVGRKNAGTSSVN